MAEQGRAASGEDAPKLFDVFLSHNSKEKPLVERIAEKLKREELEPWLDAWCLTKGGDWQRELADGLRLSSACAVFVGPHGVGDWESLELNLATDRMAKDRDFRVFLVLLPGLPEAFDSSSLPPFLSTRTWVDLRKGVSDPRAFQSLINAIKGLPSGPGIEIEPRNDTCPYRGLRPFDEDHAEFFFGRDAEVQRLTEKLKASRLLAVLGPSGSGKSSVVRAGLVPAIRKGALPGSDTWDVHIFTPGARPLTTLAANLSRLYPQASMAKTLDEMTEDQRALHLSTSRALAGRPSSERLVWVVDQFEEVFTLCTDETERARFIANLLYAALIPGGSSVVVLTMRADFYQKCASYPELSAQVSSQQFLVSPMSRESLRQAVEEPAWRVGLEFEPGLVETILEDVESQPGALPLLEHALLELWNRRRGLMLTLEAYRESGGVEGAIAKRADTIYESLDSEQQAIARRVMLRLTQPGEGTEDTRRRASMPELITRPDEEPKVQAVVQAMADSRLLTTGRDAESDEQMVDVSHEALIRNWPRLRRWLDEDREGLRVRNRLTEAAQEWRRADRDDGLLFRGARLAQTDEWRARNKSALNDLEREFLDASVELQKREREAAKKRLRRIVAGLVIALILISAASIYAFIQSRIAIQRGTESRARALAASAMAQLPINSELALLLAIEGAKAANIPETENALRQALVRAPLHTLHGGEPNETIATFSPDSNLVLTASGERAQVWDAREGRRFFELWHFGNISGISFSPDGKLAATAGGTMVRVWEVASGNKVKEFNELGPVSTVTFSPDGRLIVISSPRITGELVAPVSTVLEADSGKKIAQVEGFNPTFSHDGKLMMTRGDDPSKVFTWDAQTWKRLADIPSYQSVADMSPDGRLVITGSDENNLRLYDSRTERIAIQLNKEGEDNKIHEAVFSPDGKLVAAADYNVPRVWDAATGKSLIKLSEHSEFIAGISFSPDSRSILTTDSSGVARLYDMKSGRTMVELGVAENGGVRQAQISYDGSLLLTINKDGSVSIWDMYAWRRIIELNMPSIDSEGHENPVYRAAFSPDGRLIASASVDGVVRVWVLESGRILKEFKGEGGEIKSLEFSRDGRLVLIGGPDNSARVWELDSGRNSIRMDHEKVLKSASFSADGGLVVTAGYNSARVWRTSDGQLINEVLAQGLYASILSAMLSPDGKDILMVNGGQVQVVDLDSKQIKSELKENDEQGKTEKNINGAVFSADGRLILTGNNVWDAGTGREVMELPDASNYDYVSSASFSSDGRFILTTGYGNRTIIKLASENLNGGRVWDVRSGSVFLELRGHSAPVTSGMFSPDGKYILTSGLDGTVQIHECKVCTSFEGLLKLAGERAARELTPNERARYLQ